jgi:F0F1-type ATP synthase membrane subunit b/b'
MDWVMFIIKFLILFTVVAGVTIFVLKKVLFDSTQGAVNRLNRETDGVLKKQKELNEKIKQANEELDKRRKEADALVSKMTEDAEEKAKEEREKILKRARMEGEEIIAKAERRKEEIRQVLQKEMDMKALDFTVLILAEVLGEKSLKRLDENLVEEFMAGLDKVDMSKIDGSVKSAEVLTAYPLEKKFREQISEILRKKLNREITIEVKEDKKIIGGIILKFATLALNGSLAHMIKESGLVIKEKVEKGLL